VKNAPITQSHKKNSKERRFNQESCYGNLLFYVRKEGSLETQLFVVF